MSLQDLAASDLQGVVMNTNDFATQITAKRQSRTVTMIGIVDQQQVEAPNNRDVVVSRHWSILLIPVSGYLFGDDRDYPLPIDEYSFRNRRFEPRTPEGKDQCWEFANPTDTLYRIYVEEVSA